MRNPLFAAGAALVLSSIGCGYTAVEPQEPNYSGQSYAEALHVMCDVDKIGGIASDDPFEAGRKRTEVIRDKVGNPDGIYLRTILSVKGPAEQAVELRKEAKEAGIAQCALADDLEKSGTGGLSP